MKMKNNFWQDNEKYQYETRFIYVSCFIKYVAGPVTGPPVFDLRAPRMLGFLQARIAPSGQYCQLPSAAALLQHSTQSLLKVETSLALLQCETWELSLILPLFSEPAPHLLVRRWLACDACQPRPLSLAKVSSRFPRSVWRLTVSSFQALAWRHPPGTRPGSSPPAWLRSAAPPCLVFGRFPVLAQVLLPWDSSLQFW